MSSDTYYVSDGEPAHLSVSKEIREYLLCYFGIHEDDWPRFTVDVLVTVDKELHRKRLREFWTKIEKPPVTKHKDPKFTSGHRWGSGGIRREGGNREIACKCGARIFDGMNPRDCDSEASQPCPFAEK